ncbi:MAG: nitroreductase family protein [Rubritalea sp.]|uniref:nitroreductase family protein n=1 Tax=Rubritalea sp. TaxID=2109375 RepID=UPI0032420B22
MQNYRLLVVRDKDLRKQIRAAAWDQEQVTDASVLFILCADLNAHNADPEEYWGHAPEDIQNILGPMIKPIYEGNDELIRDEANRSTAFAGMTLMLAARELGYDSCPMIGFDKEAVSKLINLPDGMMLGFMIPVGEQSKAAWARGPRLSDKKLVFHDRF